MTPAFFLGPSCRKGRSLMGTMPIRQSTWHPVSEIAG